VHWCARRAATRACLPALPVAAHPPPVVWRRKTTTAFRGPH